MRGEQLSEAIRLTLVTHKWLHNIGPFSRKLGEGEPFCGLAVEEKDLFIEYLGYVRHCARRFALGSGFGFQCILSSPVAHFCPVFTHLCIKYTEHTWSQIHVALIPLCSQSMFTC